MAKIENINYYCVIDIAPASMSFVDQVKAAVEWLRTEPTMIDEAEDFRNEFPRIGSRSKIDVFTARAIATWMIVNTPIKWRKAGVIVWQQELAA